MNKYIVQAIIWYLKKSGWIYGYSGGIMVFGKDKYIVNRAIYNIPAVYWEDHQAAYKKPFEQYEQEVRAALKKA